MGKDAVLHGKGNISMIRVKSYSTANKELIKTLKSARDQLEKVIRKKPDTKDNYCKVGISGIPSRITFIHGDLYLYIDFSVNSTRDETDLHLNGGIIYGVQRPMCFKPCPTAPKRRECSSSIERCDGMEDKPLLHFLLNKDGIISSKIDPDSKNWDINKDILDFHMRAIDEVWDKALNWINESILP